MLASPTATETWRTARTALDAALAQPGTGPADLAELGRAEHAAWLATHHYGPGQIVAPAPQPPAFAVEQRRPVGPGRVPALRTYPPPNRLFADAAPPDRRDAPAPSRPPAPPAVRPRCLADLIRTLNTRRRRRDALTAQIAALEAELQARVALLGGSSHDHNP